MKVLMLDNYDSFVYNLVQYVGELGGVPKVFRSDKVTISKVENLKPDRIIISPGPGSPEDPRYFGICTQVLERISRRIPTLGVYLGHQGIAYAYGGRIRRAKKIMHGKTSVVGHDGKCIFKGVPNPVEVMRYHSLAVDKECFPTALEISAESIDDREVMGIRHSTYPIEGVQFHPESIMTSVGKRILKNFLDGVER